MRLSERFRDRLARASMALMAAALFYFIAYGVHEAQRAEEAGRKRDAAIAALAGTNQGIVRKLTDVFTKILELQATPEADIGKISESLRGYVDPKLIAQAVDAARKAVAGQVGPAGPTGPQGRTGPAGANATTSTTVGAPTTTTNTTRPSVSTTTSIRPSPSTTSSTTTTRKCTLGVGQLIRIGC